MNGGELGTLSHGGEAVEHRILAFLVGQHKLHGLGHGTVLEEIHTTDRTRPRFRQPPPPSRRTSGCTARWAYRGEAGTRLGMLAPMRFYTTGEQDQGDAALLHRRRGNASHRTTTGRVATAARRGESGQGSPASRSASRRPSSSFGVGLLFVLLAITLRATLCAVERGSGGYRTYSVRHATRVSRGCCGACDGALRCGNARRLRPVRVQLAKSISGSPLSKVYGTSEPRLRDELPSPGGPTAARLLERHDLHRQADIPKCTVGRRVGT